MKDGKDGLMKSKKLLPYLIPFIIVLIFVILTLTAPLRMNPVERRLNRLGLQNQLLSVVDLIISDSIDTVFVGSLTASGKTVFEAGSFQPCLISFAQLMGKVDKAYPVHYADTPVLVEQVLKGNPALEGTVVTVRELLLEEADDRFITSRLQGGNITRAVFCTRQENNAYQMDVPEICIIPEADDGSLQLWSYLEHWEDYPSFETFDAMAREKLGRFYRVDLSRIEREATEDELAELKAILETREYNAIVRRLPGNNDFTEQLFIGQLTGQIEAGVIDITPEAASDKDYSAYEEKTGNHPELLWRISVSDIRKFVPFGSSDSDRSWRKLLWIRMYLTTLPQMDGYFYFEPDTSDIVTIEPVSATFRSGTCQREMDCIFVYTRWFDQAKRNMQYTINFKIDRSSLPSVIFTSVMT